MPATVRDVLLLIRAKDQASKALGSVAGTMRRTSAAADAASARARAASLRAQAAVAKATGATKAQVAALQAGAKAYDDQARAIERNRRRHEELGRAVSGAGKAMQVAGLAFVVGGAATLYGLNQAIGVATDWDKQVRLTFTQVDKKYKPSLESLGDIGLGVAQKIATPFEQVQDALFDVFSSTEANLPQAQKLLEAFAKASVAGNTDIQTASRATIGLMNSYQIPFKDVNKVLDIQFKLVREGVGTYEEWAQRIGLVTPSAVRAGQSIDTMAAALSTMTRLGTSPARSATAVARAFDAMSNPKTEKNLKAIGVATRDAKGNFRPLVDVLADWRKELEKMPKKDRVAAILETLKGAGGTIEARRFLQQMLLSKGGLELFQDQIKTFATDKGAFQDAYNDMSNSVSAKSQLLHNNWMALKLAIGQALLPSFLQLVEVVQKVVDWFNKLPDGTKKTIAQFLLWGSILGVVGGAIAVVVGGLIGLIATVAAAGTAIFPIIGVVAAVGAVLTVVVGAIIGFGAAMIYAYQKSQAFRDLLFTVWNGIKEGWAVIVGFATGVYNSFMTNIMPALRQFAAVVETQVLPAIQSFIVWARQNLMPIVAHIASMFQDQLNSAFKKVGEVMTNTVIPAIKDLVKWWNEHKASILPVIKFLGLAVVAGAALAAFITGGMIKAIALGVQQFILFARFAYNMVVLSFKTMAAAAQWIVDALKAVRNWFKSVGEAAKEKMLEAKKAVSEGANNIKAVFSTAGTWLYEAGINIVKGLINGMRGFINQAAAEAASLAHTVMSAAKSALGIASPSKAFKDIGANVVRGFILGIKGNAKKVADVMFRLTQAIKKSIMDADISKSWKKSKWDAWSKRLANDNKRLTDYAKRRDALETRLAAATKSYNDQLKIRNDLASDIKDAVAASADLLSLDDAQKASGETMVVALQDRLKAVTAFQAGLRDLAARGLDKQTIAELAAQGVDTAGALVQTLTQASTTELNQISGLQQTIRDMAGDTGTKVAGDLYNAGINAAKGLVDGLKSQIKNITKVMTDIANALVKAIKKALGIKSPSKVFAALGTNTALGYVNGYVKKMNASNDTLAAASLFNPSAPMPAGASVNDQGPWAAARVPAKQITQHITINTREIDPRKHSAELGWELAGRV